MIRYHHDIEQGSEEWHALRCGIPTASEIRLMITQSLKTASINNQRSTCTPGMRGATKGMATRREISSAALIKELANAQADARSRCDEIRSQIERLVRRQ